MRDLMIRGAKNTQHRALQRCIPNLEGRFCRKLGISNTIKPSQGLHTSMESRESFASTRKTTRQAVNTEIATPSSISFGSLFRSTPAALAQRSAHSPETVPQDGCPSCTSGLLSPGPGFRR